MKKITFNIHSLGCKVNQYDGNILKNKLISLGCFWSPKDADIAIVNTCAVTKVALKKAKTLINRVERENPRAKIIVTGCAVKVYEEELKKGKIEIIKSENNLDQVIESIVSNLSLEKITSMARQSWIPARLPDGQAFAGMTKGADRARYTIKIQDGCEQYCSYCIVPYTRGKLKSRIPKEIISEIKNAVKAGYEEIILSGIHLGLYGKENKLKVKSHLSPNGGKLKVINLIELIKKLVLIEKLKRIRLSSIEVNEVSDELIELMVKNRKICRHLHIPLQSGSDKILKLMNRPYSRQGFADKIKKIRKAMPDIAISTDVIVGFPGETDKDFEASKKLIQSLMLSRLHVFSYSAHEKTPAAKLPGIVNKNEIAMRSTMLRELSVKLELDFIKEFEGKILEVVVEKKVKDHFVGKSQYYFDVLFDGSQIRENQKIVVGQLVKIVNR
jgi:threonylcarbamoyladenosine tRNA methylthiotransferase MtaB